MSSEDYTRNINFSSSQDYFQKLTPASLNRGIPLTPNSGSAVMQKDLSSSWSSQCYSQQTPRSYSKNFIGKQNNTKDILFLNEIRFCLHAVLSVVRDLPEKLRLLVTNSCKTKDGFDDSSIEKQKKLLEEKLAQLESIVLLSEKSFENSLETKKFQENVSLGLNEVQKYVANNEMEFKALKENFATKNATITKYLSVTKKSYLGRMAEIKSLLESLNSSITSCRVDDLGIKVQGLVDDVKKVYLMLNADEKLVKVLITQEKENANKLDALFKEVAVMKCTLENMPCIISSIIKRELEKTNARQNMRLPSSSPGINEYFTVTKKFPKYSPVARVVPRIQGVPVDAGEGPCHSLKSAKYETCVCRTSDSKYQSTLKLIEFENSSTQDLPVVNFNRPLKRNLGWHSANSTLDQDFPKVLRRQ